MTSEKLRFCVCRDKENKITPQKTKREDKMSEFEGCFYVDPQTPPCSGPAANSIRFFPLTESNTVTERR